MNAGRWNIIFLKQVSRLTLRRCRSLGMLFILLGILLSTVHSLAAQSTPAKVFVVQIQGTIDLGLAPYLARVVAEAEEQQAAALILVIDTPGGRLDAALQMRNTILDAQIPTIAFVNRDAFSAGALIAIAAEEIYMAPGAVIGAATPVDAAGEPADEKVISAVRSTFKSTAELRQRDPRIAEAMVDPAVEIDGLVREGQLLTLTSAQALERGYADGIAASLQELLADIGLAQASVQETSPSLAEDVVRFLTNPLVASLLTSLGFLLIMADILAGGFGGLAIAGLALLGLFFWGHFLAGLAGWEGVALVVAGLVLIGVEVLLIPGFGVSGVLGIAALAAGLFISMVGGTIITREEIIRAGMTVAGTLLLVIAGAVFLFRALLREGRLGHLVLQSQVGALEATPPARRQRWYEGSRLEPNLRQAEQVAPMEGSLEGKIGVALSDLRPGGFAEINGQRVDVVTEGDYIRAGELIEVIADQGYRRVVRRKRQMVDEGGGPAETDADT